MLCGAPAPACIIPALFSVDALDTCGIVTETDPREWIGTFVKMFEAAEPRTSLVKSVALIREHCDGPAPASNAFDPLGRPRCTNVPPPGSKFMAKYFRPKKVIQSKAARFSFENMDLGKRLDIYQ